MLVGLPGSGKSAVGPALAAALGRPFVDLDAEIVRREGRPIAAIFAAEGEGEARFRELERVETGRLRSAAASVVAPGGGWATQPETVALLCPPARMVYLRVTPETALRRLRRTIHLRPLLRDRPAEALARLLATRRAAYEKAELVVDTEGLTPKEVTARIAALVAPAVAG